MEIHFTNPMTYEYFLYCEWMIFTGRQYTNMECLTNLHRLYQLPVLR